MKRKTKTAALKSSVGWAQLARPISPFSGIDLGKLQADKESADKNLKAARKAYARSLEALKAAENRAFTAAGLLREGAKAILEG